MDEIQALAALRELVLEGGWTQLQTTIFIRSWPDGSIDTLAIAHEHDAFAQRTNASDLPVWREQGDLLMVIAALRQVPPPEAENAPRTVLPGDSSDRHIGLS